MEKIDPNCWYSLGGDVIKIVAMSTSHLQAAIALVQRNDPRYGPKHGAALPAMLRELNARQDALGMPLMPYTKDLTPSILQDFDTRLRGVDDRAYRAHRRLDKVDADLLDIARRLVALELIIIDEASKWPPKRKPTPKRKAKK